MVLNFDTPSPKINLDELLFYKEKIHAKGHPYRMPFIVHFSKGGKCFEIHKRNKYIRSIRHSKKIPGLGNKFPDRTGQDQCFNFRE